MVGNPVVIQDWPSKLAGPPPKNPSPGALGERMIKDVAIRL